MTKTGIPEFITGAVSTMMFFWLWPMAVVGQSLVSTYYASNAENMPIIVSMATFVFSVALFGLISIYCLAVCIEKLYYYLKPFAKEFIKW